MEKIAIEYGDGLFELAHEEGLLDEFLTDTRVLRGILRNEPSYTYLMVSRNVGKDEKEKLLADAFEGKVHRYVYNFLRLMLDRGYFGYLPSCFSRYEERYLQFYNLKRVVVRSAVMPDEEQKVRIRNSVEKKLGAKAELSFVEDPSLIAGVRIEADGILIENSAKSLLKGLKQHLGSAVIGDN